MKDDELLARVERAQRGDTQSFGLVWRALNPSVTRYLRVIVGNAAEDVASETWIAAIRGIDRFRGSGTSFRSWLFSIARSKAADWRRKQARRPQSAGDEGLDRVRATDDPAARALEGISTDAALAIVGSLPPNQAEVVALRVIAGLDVAQVADILGKRPGAVRVLAHRGLQTLAARLDDPKRAREVTP
jgi:RNA polymerase sigma-70 factor (ECF subfamily)